MNLKEMSYEEIVQGIESAPSEEKSAKIVEAIKQVVEQKSAVIAALYQKDAEELASGRQTAEKLGLRSLSDLEKQFYDKVANQSFTGTNIDLIPQTTTDYVFADIVKAHPLFDYVDMAPAGIEKWFLSESSGDATWGKLTAAIVAEIEAGITTLNIDVNKLSAFIFVPKGIIALGYEWIDKYVRTCLEESMKRGLEKGIVAGDGKDAPIGLLKNLDGAVVDGVYPNKTPVVVTDLGPDSFGTGVLPVLNRNGARAVDEIVIVANQNMMDTKIYKATHVLGMNGYVMAGLYKNFKFVVAKDVPDNKAIAYLPKRFGCGLTKVGIDASAHYKFIDDLMTYVVVAYGNGRLVANDDAVVMDITNLAPLQPVVQNIDITPAA